MPRTVDQCDIADIAVGDGGEIHPVEELTVALEATVLDDQWNIVDAPTRRQAKAVRLLIIDDDQAGEALDHLAGRRGIEMRMEPERGGGLVDRQGGSPLRAWGDCLVRAAIEIARNDQPVPMHGGGFRQMVGEIDGDFFASAQAERRAKERSIVAVGPDSASREEICGADTRAE